MDVGCISWSFLAVLSWGIAPFLDKIGLLRGNLTTVMFLQSLTITVCIFGCMVIKGSSTDSFASSFAKLDWITILAIVASGLLGGLLGEYAYLKAITGPDTAKAVALTSAYPLVTIVLSYFLLGERLTPSSVGGTLLILFGVYLLSSGGSSVATQEIASEQVGEVQLEFLTASVNLAPSSQNMLLDAATASTQTVETSLPEPLFALHVERVLEQAAQEEFA